MNLKNIEKEFLQELMDNFDDIEDSAATGSRKTPIDYVSEIAEYLIPYDMKDLLKLFLKDYRTLRDYEWEASERFKAKDSDSLHKFLNYMVHEYLKHEVGLPFLENNNLI